MRLSKLPNQKDFVVLSGKRGIDFKIPGGNEI